MSNRVMIVDDEPSVRRSVRRILEIKGFEVLEAEDGPEALETLRNEEVNLVLVDIFMPEMDGRELVKKIRNDSELDDLSLVILSVASMGEVEKEEMEEYEVLDFIEKPFDKDDLLERIDKLI